MKTLDEYNEQREKLYREARKVQHLAGVSCPQCAEKGKEIELHFSGILGAVNASHPPTKWVKCPECEYTGLMTL